MARSVQYIGSLMGAILLVSLLSILGAGLASARPAASTDAPDQVVSSGPIKQSQAEVNAYWTPQRMRSARPAEMPLGPRTLAPSAPPQGTPASQPPVAPQNNAKSTASS
jgi:hypothetical protein